ncbi:PepSY-associated TM helix domain-containing protein [Congregibacter sp.]|uniref:PepSY-associated TM helix domain-containing protein n=1 Tax=Congregibacter sp. TaxID=2744308 RepID=UPI00385EE44D
MLSVIGSSLVGLGVAILYATWRAALPRHGRVIGWASIALGTGVWSWATGADRGIAIALIVLCISALCCVAVSGSIAFSTPQEKTKTQPKKNKRALGDQRSDDAGIARSQSVGWMASKRLSWLLTAGPVAALLALSTALASHQMLIWAGTLPENALVTELFLFPVLWGFLTVWSLMAQSFSGNTQTVAKKKNKAKTVQRALSAHGVLGVAIAAGLYLVCLSGTVSVFKDQLEVFEQRKEIPQVSALNGEELLKASREAIKLDPDTKHLVVYPPTQKKNTAIVGTDNRSHYADAKGRLALQKVHPWSSFLIDLHYYLNLPHSFGMIVVAIFGVLLFGMSLSGLLAHPNIVKDAFSFRRGKSSRLMHTDIHNRLSVWTMPFHLSNSLTGAMIGLASISAFAIASLNYEGDTSAVFAPVFGSEPPVDLRSAPIARMDLALLHVQENYAFTKPVLLVLHDPNTEGQYLQIFAEHPDRLIYAEKYNYNRDGEFLGTVGSADGSIGQQVGDSVYKVHFGSFGGMPVKIAYALFGICLLFIIHSGMRVYFLKRQAREKNTAGMYGAWLGIALGAPSALALTLPVSLVLPLTQAQLQLLFWLGLVLAVCFGFYRGYRSDSRAALAASPVVQQLV